MRERHLSLFVSFVRVMGLNVSLNFPESLMATYVRHIYNLGRIKVNVLLIYIEYIFGGMKLKAFFSFL